MHRIGRTARAGAKGKALTFIAPDDNYLWNKINKIVKLEKIDSIRTPKGKTKLNKKLNNKTSKKKPSWLKKRESGRKKKSLG